LPSFSDIEIGYIEKRSNAKRWIEDTEDLEAMYNTFATGDEITLWCNGQQMSEEKKSRKRKNDETEATLSSKRANKDEQIDQLVQKLKEKHDNYSVPQLRLWARMKLGGQHESLDDPPRIPLFTGTCNKTCTPRRDSNPLSDALTNVATAVVNLLTSKESSSPSVTVTTGISPSKRAAVSGQYLDQLEKLKKLFESGVLTQEEFDEQKHFALKNIRILNS